MNLRPWTVGWGACTGWGVRSFGNLFRLGYHGKPRCVEKQDDRNSWFGSLHGIGERSQRIAPQTGSELPQAAYTMRVETAAGGPQWFCAVGESTQYPALLSINRAK